jgi:chloride channel protein, CIC family
LVPDPSSFAVVGMAGFFAAAAKTPFSTLIIVSEMTGGYLLLLPALWVTTMSFMLSDRQSIYSQQVESRTRSGAHQGAFVREALAGATVAKFLATVDRRVLHPGDPLGEVLNQFDSAGTSVMPVVDEDHTLLGMVDLEEVYLASHAPALRPLIVAADLMRSDVTPVVPGDSLERAYELCVENQLQALPIVNDHRERRVLGLVRRGEVASAYLRMLYGSARSESSGAQPN